MGVPKFFRWISERYPCLSQLVQEHQIPEFDNLYLDMNGIIHVCSHPDDDNVHFRLTDEDLFKAIFHYIEFLFRLIKPQRVFFMAIDGVAPRAKMNQQRSRRFRTAKAMEDQERIAIQRGEKLPTTKRFDSNAITPGTEFMVKLQEQLKYFVMKKVSSDSLWHDVDVILSGHETPGEGEHKIMDFIRYQRSQPNYNANTRHCLYGLDADLIMLGLTSHEPNFCLLREEVRYDNKSKNKRANIPEEMRYYLLHLSLLREYIDHEFSDLKSLVRFPYNLERIIDDWILLGFMVGNDFVPHLPALHIHDDALPKLWSVYRQVLPDLDGYLHENGNIALNRLERYMEEVGKIDENSFDERYCDSKWLMGKRGHKTAQMLDSLKDGPTKPETRGNRHQDGKSDGPEEAVEAFRRELRDEGLDEELANLVPFDDYFEDADLDGDGSLEPQPFSLPQSANREGNSHFEEEEEEEEEKGADTERRLFLREFRQFKCDYYSHKLGVLSPSQEWLRSQALEYVRALQWILRYYFEGVPSWSWFYPQHYAPFASDVCRFANLGPISFERSTPFLPFQQLMAVLPAGSADLLPEPYHLLMTESTSPIIDFYPTFFDTDLNGKKQEWEAVVLIPFIEEQRLLNGMASVEDKLLPNERERNRHGPHLLYRYSADEKPITYPSSLPGVFPNLENCQVKVAELHQELHHVAKSSLVSGRHEGVRPDLFFSGFPVLNNLKHKFRLERKGIKVFQYNSREASMLLYIGDGENEEKSDEEEKSEEEEVKEDERKIVEAAKAMMGREVLVQWPHLVEGLVVQILSLHWKCVLPEDDEHNHHKHDYIKTPTDQSDRGLFRTLSTSLVDKAIITRGIDVGRTHCIIFAKMLAGKRHVVGPKGNVELEKQWSMRPCVFLQQRCLQRLPMASSVSQKFESVTDLYPVGATIFSLAHGHSYGCMGEVTGHADGKSSIQVKLSHVAELDLSRLWNGDRMEDIYLSSHQVAQRLNVTSHFISRITGSIFLFRGSEQMPSTDKMNIGLNIKFNKACEEVLGFSRREVSTGPWTFSEQTVAMLREYRERFPDVFNYITRCTNQDLYYEQQMLGEHPDPNDVIVQMKEFFDNLPSKKSQRVPHGNRQISDETVGRIIEEITNRRQDRKRISTTLLKPSQLFRCVASQGYLIPERNETFNLMDRVVNVRPGCTVPLGMHGTIVGIVRNQTKNETENDPSLLTNSSKSTSNTQDWTYEILFDSEFDGALPSARGAGRLYRLRAYSLINLTHGRHRGEGRRNNSNRTEQDFTDYHQSWNLLRQQHRPDAGIRHQQRQLWHQTHQNYPPQGRDRQRRPQAEVTQHDNQNDPQMAAAIAALDSINLSGSVQHQSQRPVKAASFSGSRGRGEDGPGIQFLRQVCQHFGWPFPYIASNFNPQSNCLQVTLQFPNGFECNCFSKYIDDALYEMANELWIKCNPQQTVNQVQNVSQNPRDTSRQSTGFVPLQVSRKKAAPRVQEEVRPVRSNQWEPVEVVEERTSSEQSRERRSQGESRNRGRRRIGAKFPGAQRQ